MALKCVATITVVKCSRLLLVVVLTLTIFIDVLCPMFIHLLTTFIIESIWRNRKGPVVGAPFYMAIVT